MPKAKPRRDRFVLLWVYGDAEDSPYLVVNPPRNFGALLREWNTLDRLLCENAPGAEEWEPVNVWLSKRGVSILQPRELHLDDYR
jgi:hypothetical protein